MLILKFLPVVVVATKKTKENNLTKIFYFFPKIDHVKQKFQESRKNVKETVYLQTSSCCYLSAIKTVITKHYREPAKVTIVQHRSVRLLI